jgi:hypothetical protein
VSDPNPHIPRLETGVEGLDVILEGGLPLPKQRVTTHVEHRAKLLRALTILNMRDTDYDPAVREVRFTEEGFSLLNTFDAELQLTAGGGFAGPGDTGPSRRS